MEYNVHDILSKKYVPKEVEDTISIFREKIIDTFQYKVDRVMIFKCLIENNGKKIPIFDHKKNDKELGLFNINKKFYKDPFYQEYVLERESLFAEEFESLLSWIENRYDRLKSLTTESGEPVYTIIRAFKKAVSGGLCSGSNFFIFGVGYRFLFKHFSFVHGTFRERNFDLFHGEKHKFIRMELQKSTSGSVKLSGDSDKTSFLTLIYSDFPNQEDREEIISFNSLKEKYLFISLFNKFKEYTYTLNINPFIANAIYSMGLSKSSKQKIALTYVLIDDEPIDLIKKLKHLRLKNKDYSTDVVYRFKNLLELDTAIHPISLITHKDYMDFTPEQLDLFIIKILSSSEINYFNGFSPFSLKNSIFNKRTEYLFNFIEKFGLEFTLNILSKDININNLNYDLFSIIFEKNLEIDVNYLGNFRISNGFLYNGENYDDYEERLETAFNSLQKEEFLKNTNFAYYNQPLFERDLKRILSNKKDTFFDSINHLFFFSLLDMIGINIHQLSFEDAINTEIKSYLRTNNQIVENSVLEQIVCYKRSFYPIERKKHLIALSFIKKINTINDQNIISFEKIYLNCSKKTELELKDIWKRFIRFLRTNPDFEEVNIFLNNSEFNLEVEFPF